MPAVNRNDIDSTIGMPGSQLGLLGGHGFGPPTGGPGCAKLITTIARKNIVNRTENNLILIAID